MVAKEYLDSDRVNFLIWRYLLEGNYRETAAKFQKEWHVAEPHRQFPFAPNVRSQALVQIVQRGLLYYALEREHAFRQRLGHDAGAVEAERHVGVFGPLETLPEQARKPAPVEQQQQQQQQNGSDSTDADDAANIEISRKRPADGIISQQQHANSTAKRPRLGSNGFEIEAGATATASTAADAPAATAATAAATGANTVTTATTPTTAVPTTAMDIDLPQHDHQNSQENVNSHAYPSPLEAERAPSPVVHTEGPEQATQVDKVEELATETTFLRLQSDDVPEPITPPLQVFANGDDGGNGGNGGSSDSAPILLHCEWSPRDPSSLAAAGTDSLARIWTVPHTRAALSTPDHDQNHVIENGVADRPFRNLVDEDTPRNSTVTALAWNWDGTALALATDLGSKARISVWDTDGNCIHRFDLAEPPVIRLRWSPDNAALLAVSPQNGGTSVTVFSWQNLNTLNFSLEAHDLNWAPLDAAWIGETDFLLCGGDLFLFLRYTLGGIELIRKFETRHDDNFSQVLFDWRSKLAATANDKGTIDLWDETGQRRSIPAHTGTITALQWQPQQTPPPDNERLIASSGDDCAVLVWNARIPENKAKCYMTMDSPVVAIAFTPDGAFIAGATAHQVLIWKIGEHAMPRASWTRAPHPGWLSPKANVDVEDEEDSYCLCWDSTGQKLAYGANSRLAIIRFR